MPACSAARRTCCATTAACPNCQQLDVVRHFFACPQRNFGVDTGFYPLGSCTMKYNPKVNELIAAPARLPDSPSFAGAETVQGISR